MNFKSYLALFLLFLYLLVFEKIIAQSPNWIWAKSMGSKSEEWGNCIAVDTAGNGDIYVAGSFMDTVDFDPGLGISNLISAGFLDVFISKFDKDGNFIWAKSIGNVSLDQTSSIVIDPNGSGDVYVTGIYDGLVDFDPGPGKYYLNQLWGSFILKLDASGNFVWARAINSTGGLQTWPMSIDHSGNLYLSGQFRKTGDFDPGPGIFNLTSVGNSDIFILKLNNEGNFQWAKSIGGTENDYCYELAIDPSGSGYLYLTGNFAGKVDLNPNSEIFEQTSLGRTDVFVLKLDLSGNFIWVKTIGSLKHIWSQSIAVDLYNNSDIYLTGYFLGQVDFDPGIGITSLNTDESADVFILKLDSTGNFVWARAIESTDYIGVEDLAIEPESNGFCIVGNFKGTIDLDPGPNNYYLTSVSEGNGIVCTYDQQCNFNWAKTMKGGGLGTIAYDASGFIYATGGFDFTSISFDSITLYKNGNLLRTPDILIAKLGVSLPTSLQDLESQNIFIYPNPTTDKIKIEISNHQLQETKITLFNLIGEVISKYIVRNISDENVIDVSSLSNGIYFLELNIDEKKAMKKILKN